MNRTELQKLADDRLLDAKALLDAGRWSGAYYLAGYAVECALKSCVLHYIERTGIIFKDRRYAEKLWTHSVKDLVKFADLYEVQMLAIGANPALAANWSTVERWNEASRYQQTPEIDAQSLYNAVFDPVDGVLSWIKNHW